MWSGINSLTMVSRSLQLAQWNWITRADAGCLQVDGKTLCSFTVFSYHVNLQQPNLIAIRDVDRRNLEDLMILVGLIFTLWFFIFTICKIKKQRDRWLLVSLTGAVVFDKVAKYIQKFIFKQTENT